MLLLIVAERFVPGVYAALNDALVLSGHTVTLKVLTSPGIVLLLVAAALFWHRPVTLPHKTVLARAWAACLSLFIFIVLAQVMRQSGMIAAFADTLAGWNSNLLLVFAPLMGMVSGFITGSNLGGNALTMTLQGSIGARLGLLPLFAAAQNSGAGHAVFTSIPIIVLILALAKDAAPQSTQETAVQEHHLLRFGLLAAFCLLLVLTLTTWGLRLFLS